MSDIRCVNCYYHKHKCFQCAIDPANDVGLIYLGGKGGKRNTNGKPLNEEEEKL